MIRGQVFVRSLLARTATKGITSARRLAAEAGIDYATVRAWQRGATPTPRTLERLTGITGLSVAEMLDLWQGTQAEPATLTDAIAALTAELREWREGQWEERIATLEAAVALLAQRDEQGSAEHAPLRGAAG